MESTFIYSTVIYSTFIAIAGSSPTNTFSQIELESTLLTQAAGARPMTGNRDIFPGQVKECRPHGHSRDLPAAADFRHAEGDWFLPRCAGVSGSRHVFAWGRLQLGVAQVAWRRTDAEYGV